MSPLAGLQEANSCVMSGCGVGTRGKGEVALDAESVNLIVN